jgi:hypothetical protein
MKHIILYPSKKSLNRLKIIGDSESVLDDGIITLPTGVTGWLDVQFGDNTAWGRCMISANGTVEIAYCDTTPNLVNTNTDTKCCVYDGGSGAVIKNRSGGTLTVRWEFKYS